MGNRADGADGLAGIAADADLRVDDVLFDDDGVGAHAWLSNVSSANFEFAVYWHRSGLRRTMQLTEQGTGDDFR